MELEKKQAQNNQRHQTGGDVKPAAAMVAAATTDQCKEAKVKNTHTDAAGEEVAGVETRLKVTFQSYSAAKSHLAKLC